MAPTFPKFRELPAELQLQIWNLALVPRVIEFTIIRQDAERTNQRGEPILRILNMSGAHPVSLACRDSRNEALRKYKSDYTISYHVKFRNPNFKDTSEQYPVYSVQYDPLQDTILFSSDETLQLFYDSYDILPRNGAVADMRVLPIKSLSLRGYQLRLHGCPNFSYITQTYGLEELIRVTAAPKWLSWLLPTAKAYVDKLERKLKLSSKNFLRSRTGDFPEPLPGRTWQDFLSPWWANPTITCMTEDEFRDRFYVTPRPSLLSRVKIKAFTK